MAMFMYVYKIFISLLLLLFHCEVTMEQATRGPLLRICTTTWYNRSLSTIPPPLAEEDENVINDLLGCSGKILPPSCSIGNSNPVTCDCYNDGPAICRVVFIDFSNRRLEGSIPESIGNLQYLRSLNLNGNKLGGSIPDSFQYLTRLTELFLCDNSLQGSIPHFIGQMKSLTSIYLCKNFFNQGIPPQLDSLPSLEYLHLGSNFLSGKIPPELGNIKSLVGLYLMDNQLSDILPNELGNLENLEDLHLQNNEFIGPLPDSFKKLTKLTYFNVRGNNLIEKIPNIFQQWQDLHYMDLMGNDFSAPLPSQIWKLKNLKTLHINNLVGQNFSFPDSTEMKLLNVLTLRKCSINGSIPDWIWKLPDLQYLDLSFNYLHGGFPNVTNHSLRYIYLRKNNLNETIPAWMNDNTSAVDVSENNFSTVSISPLEELNPKLNLFACCYNKTDQVAKRDQIDYNCKNGALSYDHLHINCGGESIQVNSSHYDGDVNSLGASTFYKSNTSNWAYSSMGRFLWSKRNNYIQNDTCQIDVGDAQIYLTSRVAPISLKYYGFCMKNGEYNVKLHFAEISSGDNNKVLQGKGKRIFNVDIQDKNELKNFNIEKAAGGSNKAMDFKTSVNNNLLEIHLYWTGKGSVLYPSPYYGPLISAIAITPAEKGKSTGVLVGISGFALLLLLLFIGFSWRLQDKLRRKEVVELYPGALYNYHKIKVATKNFAIANRLGEGGFGTVYMGTLSNGTAVAVKKLSATKEGMREFAEKGNAIADMKHPNIVTLMGCCVGNNQLLLIYEYIGTNTLEDALFGSDELRARLDWPTRCKICLGLAEGLLFLHEGSNQKIIHGNIKPANILLDDDLNPKIYDFGFAKLYHKQKLEATRSYTAPEVKDRPLEASADVYGFGVVTLILVSGMQITTPRAGGEVEYLVEEARKKDRNGTLMQLIDQNLNYDWEEAQMILKLAIKCIDYLQFRPTMSTIVEDLKKNFPNDTILMKP